MRRRFSIDKKAFFAASVVTLGCLALVFYGSRKLQNFDPALIAYLFGTLFALAAGVYRYAVWLQRPPTWLYFKRSMQFIFNGRLIVHLFILAKESLRNLAFQGFIYPRSRQRWFAHFMLASGCLAAFAVTIPLTLGWINFTLDPASAYVPQAVKIYHANFFGFRVMNFRLGSIPAFLIFHILTWCSYLVILGCVLFLVRRLTKAGLIATQTFEGDLLPLLLLIIISVTGLGLNFSYAFMQGFAYTFMAVTHAISVILFLVWMPFGKFFHIIQRPAQIGVHLYRKEGEKRGMAVCPHTHQSFATQLHIEDLKKVTLELGFDFTLEDGTSHLDYSPEGKRSLFAKAHLEARRNSGVFFG
jgi:hypothetical protein